MNTRILPLMLLFALFAIVACNKSASEEAGEEESTENQDPLQTLTMPFELSDTSNVIMTEQGVKIYVLEEGDGALGTDNEKFVVVCHGFLEDGTVFQPYLQGNAIRPLKVRTDNVISGWGEVLRNVKVGSMVRAIIPPELGYGEEGKGKNIPPNSTLIFDMYIMSSEPME